MNLSTLTRGTLVAMAAVVVSACGRESTAPATVAQEGAVGVRGLRLASSAPTPVVHPQAQGGEPGVRSNDACTTLGYDFGIKINYNTSWAGTATYPVTFNGVEYGTVTLTSTDGVYFDWTSTFGLDAMVVHGGQSGFNEYAYAGAEGTSGTGFSAPNNIQTASPAGISNVSFCFDLELGSTITAAPTFTRSYDWSINKALVTASDAALTLAAGQTSAPVSYVVSLANTFTDSDWALAGTFTITNPGFLPATGVTATVNISDAGAALVSCPSTSIAAGGAMTCSYSAAMTDGASRTVTLSATTDGATLAIPTTDIGALHFYGAGDIGATTSSTAASFLTPTSVVDEEVTVSDNLKGALGIFNLGSASLSTTYQLTFGPYAACETKQIDNIASLVTNDRGNAASATASVSVSVVGCDAGDNGCTLTQGYWKTHSQTGPAPYDNAWQNLGALQQHTVFFLSGQTWLQVFNTAPAGNSYYTLAHQYMAAKLNILNGAASTPAVTASIAAAEALFNAYTPAQVSKSKTLKDQFSAYVGTLGSYNEGLTGPGHCSQ